MRHGIYTGPHRALRGCGALIQPAVGVGSRWVLAQFDRVKAPEAESMCYGWHCLPRKHFKLRPSRSAAHWRKIARGWLLYELDEGRKPFYGPSLGSSSKRRIGFDPIICAPFEKGAEVEIGADLYYMAAEGMMRVTDTRGPVRLFK